MGEVLYQVDSVLSSAAPAAKSVPLRAKDAKANADSSRQVPRLTSGQHETFEYLWAHDIPVIVTDVGRKLKGQWTPEAFVNSHGTESVEIITVNDCDVSVRKGTVEEFFNEFLKDDAVRGYAVKVKVSHSGDPCGRCTQIVAGLATFLGFP